MRNLANFVLFQIGWFACVIGGGSDRLGEAYVVTLAVLALHFTWITQQRGRELLLVVGVTAGGTLVTAFNIWNGAVRFPTGGFGPIDVPLFIVALWLLFAMLLGHSLGWLRGRPALAALCAAIGSPLSYRAAASFGAVEVHADFWRGPVVLGVTWAIAVPLALATADRVLDSDTVTSRGA